MPVQLTLPAAIALVARLTGTTPGDGVAARVAEAPAAILAVLTIEPLRASCGEGRRRQMEVSDLLAELSDNH